MARTSPVKGEKQTERADNLPALSVCLKLRVLDYPYHQVSVPWHAGVHELGGGPSM